eukprot:1448884-Prymnesium_polylepis.2
MPPHAILKLDGEWLQRPASLQKPAGVPANASTDAIVRHCSTDGATGSEPLLSEALFAAGAAAAPCASAFLSTACAAACSWCAFVVIRSAPSAAFPAWLSRRSCHRCTPRCESQNGVSRGTGPGGRGNDVLPELGAGNDVLRGLSTGQAAATTRCTTRVAAAAVT